MNDPTPDLSAQARPRIKINPPVFVASVIIVVALVLFSSLAKRTAAGFFDALKNTVTADASWFYMLTVGLILALVVFLAFSRYGDIKLGKQDSEPDYSYTSWFAMLFSAGMGIGLMFFGVAEPVMHFMAPPVGEPGTVEAAREAMRATFFHWGLHAWAIYAIVALILAYFSFRHSLPLTLRSALYPLVGRRIYGPIGHIVDIFAVVGTVFGIATSLGFGVEQVNGGLNYLFGLPATPGMKVVLIIVITSLATLSVVSGLDVGIRRLSELNLGLAFLLLLFVLVLGPTTFLLKTYVQNWGYYLSQIVDMTFNLYAYQPNEKGGPQEWLGGWTLFYWGWWLSWSPFVGMFIARISRGRTIREFALGVMLVPAAFTLLWMTVFGDAAILMILDGSYPDLSVEVKNDAAVALFHFLEQFPLSGVVSGIATLMVVVFFVTSADSGAMVVDMLASGGADDTPIWQRIFWAALAGIAAITLMLAGGLQALQSATIASALPFAIVLLISCFGLLRALKIEGIRKRSFTANLGTLPPPAIPQHGAGGGWRKRLRGLISFPPRERVERFIEEVAKPALRTVAQELRAQGAEATVDEAAGRVSLRVAHGAEIDFIYGVRLRGYDLPSITFRQLEETRRHKKETEYYRADVFLREGGQDYDVMGYSAEQLIDDVLDQYEKHMYFLHLLR